MLYISKSLYFRSSVVEMRRHLPPRSELDISARLLLSSGGGGAETLIQVNAGQVKRKRHNLAQVTVTVAVGYVFKGKK